jgi:hypothetical protein
VRGLEDKLGKEMQVLLEGRYREDDIDAGGGIEEEREGGGGRRRREKRGEERRGEERRGEERRGEGKCILALNAAGVGS